jgi:hypothetical protein
MEIWKDITGYENLYQISNEGRVKSLARKYIGKYDKIMKPALRNNYPMVELFKNKIGICYSVHRLVALEFINKPDNKNIVNHINKNTCDNRVENLEWVTQSENDCHKFINANKTSKFSGVHFDKSKKRFVATAYSNGKQIKLGIFKLETDAYEARVNFYKENQIENKYL